MLNNFADLFHPVRLYGLQFIGLLSMGHVGHGSSVGKMVSLSEIKHAANQTDQGHQLVHRLDCCVYVLSVNHQVNVV